jgi:hypothetical protein
MRALFRRRPAVPTPGAIRYRTAPDVVSAVQGERAVLLDARRGRYFGVDEVGVAIWEALSRGATVPEIVDGLERSYAAPRARLERDVADFLAMLRRRKLVETG